MDFSLDDDHIVLRDSADSFVDKETSLDTLLIPGATVSDAPYGENWEKIKALGWPGLVVPEAQGGIGLDCVELLLILTALGRRLMPSPFLGHLFGTWALMRAGSETQRERLLPDVALGQSTLALVPPADGNAVGARTEGGSWRLSGGHGFVIDASAADVLVVAARTENEGYRFFLVDARQPGVATEPCAWRDITRQVCRVAFTDAKAECLPGDVNVAWPWIRDRAAFALAAENAGGLRKVLNDSVDYANERVAFGRPIGAYQAIKHPLADMLGQVECANTATLYAAWALAEADPRASLAASMAKAYSSDAYVAATHRSIQIFGAIGFTWEMPNHLYFKRARANAEMFGSARLHREHVINVATGRNWTTPFDLDELTPRAA